MLELSTLLLTFSFNLFSLITVAKSTNVLAWDCRSDQASKDSNFTVLCVLSFISSTPGPQLTLISIDNTNHLFFLGPLAVVAIQKNADCSVTISQDQINQPAGSGYIITFANPLNNTDVSSIINFLSLWSKLTQLILGLRYLPTIRDQTSWIIVSQPGLF